MSESASANAYRPALGIDVGTYTIVLAQRNTDGDVEYRHEVNGFVEIEINEQTRMMLDMIEESKSPVYKPPSGQSAFVLGYKAREIAYSMAGVFKQDASDIFRRTMRDGIMSVKDSVHARNVLATILHGMARGSVGKDIPICFSTPGDPYPKEGADDPVAYHRNLVGKMLSKVGNVEADPFDLNEAMAITYAESPTRTAVSFSFGAGMTNVSFSIMGIPIFQFSIVGGGDSIDRGVAHRLGIDPVVANVEKMGNSSRSGIDLTAEPSGSNAHVQQAIIAHYEMLIDKVATAFSEFVRRNEAKVMEGNEPEVIVAGGTASPKGFIEMLEKRLRSCNLGSFRLGAFRRTEKNLFTVAKGLLLYAENIKRS